MIVVSVMYPASPEDTFDAAYYVERHIPMVKERWTPFGLSRVDLLRATGTPDRSPPPYPVMALLTFDSLESFRAAGKAHGAEIFGDVPNFSSVHPTVQINETLGPATP